MSPLICPPKIHSPPSKRILCLGEDSAQDARHLQHHFCPRAQMHPFVYVEQNTSWQPGFETSNFRHFRKQLQWVCKMKDVAAATIQIIYALSSNQILGILLRGYKYSFHPSDMLQYKTYCTIQDSAWPRVSHIGSNGLCHTVEGGKLSQRRLCAGPATRLGLVPGRLCRLQGFF